MTWWYLDFDFERHTNNVIIFISHKVCKLFKYDLNNTFVWPF